jgi:hypothetical protein
LIFWPEPRYSKKFGSESTRGPMPIPNCDWEMNFHDHGIRRCARIQFQNRRGRLYRCHPTNLEGLIGRSSFMPGTSKCRRKNSSRIDPM